MVARRPGTSRELTHIAELKSHRARLGRASWRTLRVRLALMTDLAPDGSPVTFYRRLPAMGEPELIHAVIPPGASVLDLGCGPLLALGHSVAGIDNGRAMIAALPAGIEGIVADARTVRLGRRFGAVLLASHLLNDPEAGRLSS
jgi:hypothetical protein